MSNQSLRKKLSCWPMLYTDSGLFNITCTEVNPISLIYLLCLILATIPHAGLHIKICKINPDVLIIFNRTYNTSRKIYIRFTLCCLMFWLNLFIWLRSRNCGCLVTWFCYHLIAKPGNKTATVLWPDPYHSGLLHWHCEKPKIASVPMKLLWRIWVNRSHDPTSNN